ncbi:cellulase family glycosylhydrolase [Longispora sp. K20-0274]|uniref:glycoside hydrolase family 5 protein n=1 Tax=Longispora sp. K20-0274 TaxID=3088255 RepID=UPI003999A82A
MRTRSIALRAVALAAAAVGVLAGAWAPVRAAAPPTTASWTPPLSTRGRYVVDATGQRFKLTSANWSGAQGTYLGSGDPNDPANNANREVSHNLPVGLDRVPLTTLLADLRAVGINSVRLPFADALLHDSTVVPDAAVAANPQLRGKTPLQVYDAVVAALTADGFAVILNNHTTGYRWCCGLDGNERWNSGQSTDQWIADWVFLAERYRANKRVAGVDLRNEVRRDTWDDPNWGWGDEHDLYRAYQLAAERILATDPDLLIVMEGINWYGIPSALFPHGRPQLKPVANLSHTLTASNKLVYSAHFYGFTGSANTGADGGWGATSDPRYRDLSPADLASTVVAESLFVTMEGQHFTAPVWISEFGVAGRGGAGQQDMDWFRRFTDLLALHDVDFAYWSAIGWSTDGVPNERFALLSYAPDGSRLGINDPGDGRTTDWRKLLNAPSRTGFVAPSARWNMLDLDFADHNASATMLARPDWSPGNRKASCPDTQRLVGLGRSSSRGLCGDALTPPRTSAAPVVVTDERYVTDGDWASGYSKLQCPTNSFAIGYAVRDNAMSALLCAPAARALPTTGRNVWFDHGDNRPAGAGSTASDWSPGYYKGQCADTEYVAGVAYTWRWSHGGVPDALLCRPL